MSDARELGGVPPLLRGLVDDAGLFPPERLPMESAIVRHRADEVAGHPMLTHRFLCPASRVGQLRTQLGDCDRFRLGVIADTGLDDLVSVLGAAGDDGRLAIELVEVPLGSGVPADEAGAALDALADLPAGTAAYVELQRVPGWLDAVGVLADRAGGEHGISSSATNVTEGRATTGATGGATRGAKIRCGGVRAELFPTAAELGEFVRTCAAAGVPFKATAGLHHAVRYRDAATGFDHHGFLNLLLATALAASGVREDDLLAVLACADGGELGARALELDADTAVRTRELLVSYGSCSTSEPIDDVTGLGLVTAEEG